jgi:tetratricopeptide (TPR) repeat protein
MAVHRLVAIAAAALFMAALPLAAEAQSDGGELREQFSAVIDGLNANSFKAFHEAIDVRVFSGRILGTRVISDDARQILGQNFKELLEGTYVESFPAPRTQADAQGEILGTIVSFEESGGRARAIVRFAAEGFRYSYHAYDLTRGGGGRVQIVDWLDYYQGSWFSEHMGNALVEVMPTQQAVAGVLALPNATGGQLFQVGELLKSSRDRNPKRYFDILDNMDDVLRESPFIVAHNFKWCRALRDQRRLQAAAAELARLFPGDARFSLSLAEFYVQYGRFEEAIEQFDVLETALGIEDGVIESLKATAAMALGDFEKAQAYAANATQVEPGLELAWWTLLRTRTAAEDYEGALEPLTALEDRFGKLLIPQNLRRDRFLKVLIDQPPYQEWRAARDAD